MTSQRAFTHAIRDAYNSWYILILEDEASNYPGLHFCIVHDLGYNMYLIQNFENTMHILYIIRIHRKTHHHKREQSSRSYLYCGSRYVEDTTFPYDVSRQVTQDISPLTSE